ncbi:MAG: hypothetical protein KKB13_05610 [Chloroflexi bacterium]|nr:hypothetical protein [Chloroflexota bacterium]
MEQVTPYLVCVGVLCIWPGLLMALGYYLGHNGSPISIKWQGVKRGDSDDL